MSDAQHIRTDDDRWERIVELTAGAANTCLDCDVCEVVCPWSNWEKDGPDLPTMLRAAQSGATPDSRTDKSLWGCCTCASCEATCPKGVKVTDVLLGLRGLAFEDGRAPTRLSGLLKSLQETGNPGGHPAADKMKWAKGLDLPPMNEERGCLVYFGSAACYDLRLQRISQALESVLSAIGLDFGVLDDEPDSGAVVRFLGEQAYLEQLIDTNLETFKDFGVREIVAVSPYDYDMFMRIYPRFGDSFRVFHITEYLDQLIQFDQLAFAHRGEARRVLYHDPCYLGRHHNVYDPPRRVLQAMPGLELVEFAQSREQSLCCGGGGARMFMNENAGECFSDERVQEAKDLGIDMIVTPCPSCIQMFEESLANKFIEGIEVRGVVELAAAWSPYSPSKHDDAVYGTQGTA